MNRKKNIQQKGFALLLSIIVASIVLAVGVSILNVSVSQLALSSTARESEIAFQAAHAGLDCMQYWRNTDADAFINWSTGDNVPNKRCFGDRDQDRSAWGGRIKRFNYTYDWGDPAEGEIEKCTKITMDVMVPNNNPLTRTYTGYETIDEKTCEVGDICTIIFSKGYNRACDDLNSSIFTIERELVLEY